MLELVEHIHQRRSEGRVQKLEFMMSKWRHTQDYLKKQSRLS
ncbi:protein of unknown function [Ectopseudomonas oleovorans]|nr:protein of unknown function [Pseudomonas oleovorans]